MAERRSFLLAAISLAALGLMAPAEAADMATTPAPAQPYVAPAPAAVPVTTTAPPARDNSLIVMPIPPQPSPATVDAAAHRTGNPINKPVTGASIEPEVVGGDRPLSLESLQATRPGSGLAADGLEPGRQDILYQAGLAYGARGGLAARAFAINEMLRRYESTLDSVYNFDDVILRRTGSQIIMRPPVISEAEMALALGDGGQIARETACVYSISKVAQLGSAPPNWRTYLVRTWEQPSRPADAVLPRTEQEVQYWNKYVAEGWAEGERQAVEIFLNDLGRLQRDITGMARYRVLLRAGVVAKPNVATKQQVVDGGGGELGRATGSSPSRRNRASGRTPACGAARAVARSEGDPMLDRPSREPETPHDPYAWVDAGERWVKEPRRAAPALDAFLTHAHRLGAEQVMFSTFQPASFRLWGRNRKVTTRDPLDENDASMIVNHLYGADGMARLQGGGDINVMYQIGSPRKGTLRFRCNVTAITASRGAGANVVIRPVRDLPQPLDQQNVEPEILAHYRMTKGMMIVSGATGSGKSTLIGAMTVEKLRDPDAHRNIIECAEPVEFLLDRVESVTSTISQSEIPRNVKSFEDFMAGAMRRQPTDIIIGECRKPEHMIATIQAAISGHATATTIHAETVPLTMQRVASLLPPAQLKDAMISCAQALRLVINQRLVKSRDGKWTPLREFLVCDAPYRKRLASARADDWPQITAEAVDEQGQSYAKAIGVALAEGRIDEETAEKVRQEIG